MGPVNWLAVLVSALVALGVTSAHRSPTLPEVPVFADTLPGFEATGWYGLLAPAKTPPHTIAMLNAEIDAALKDPEVRKLFEDQGIQLLGGSPGQFASLIASETKKWAAVIQRAGIKAD